MRKNFAQILKEAKVDIKSEYQKLYSMLFDKSIPVSNTNRISAYDEISDNFINFYFRDTCLSIDEFNDLHGFHFEKDPLNFNIDHLISLCEYIENMLMGYQSATGYKNLYGLGPINVHLYSMQIYNVIEKIGYMRSYQDGFAIFVEKTPTAIAAAESEYIPQDLSYKLISYNHFSMKGQIEEKKTVLLQFASILESKRSELKKINKTFEQDLFYIFNNLNLRHNNTDPEVVSKYKAYVAHMSKDDLEKWYDETYQMCLFAILQLEHKVRKQELDILKSKIETQN